jgi:hypothetical protein
LSAKLRSIQVATKGQLLMRLAPIHYLHEALD